MDGPQHDPLIDAVLGGRYRILSQIDEGGVGVVYEGRHEQIGRSVAVKVLHAGFGRDEETVRRFEREARTAGGLGHPNIVDVYDFGRLPDGRPYLVMELLDGVPLSSLVEDGGALPLTEVATIVAEIARALDAVHSRGIVHRDVKPENVFLVRDGDSRMIAKLLDFGLARSALGNERLTRAGTYFGTPEYMAPEITQRDGPEPVNDVYALATTAFELLTGELPFENDNPWKLLTMKREQRAPTLREVSGVEFAEAIEAVIARGLLPDPALRHLSAGAFARELCDAVPGSAPAPRTIDLPLPSRRRPARPSPELPIRPWKRQVVAGLAMVVLLASGAMAWTGFAPAPEHAEAAAPEALPAPREDAVTPPEPAAIEAPAAIDPPTTIDIAPSEPTTAALPVRRRVRRSQPARVDAPEPVEVVEPPSPEETRLRTRDAYRLLARGRIPDAAERFYRVTLDVPAHAPAWRGLGLSNEHLGRRGRAARAYRRYLELAPPTAEDRTEIASRLRALE